MSSLFRMALESANVEKWVGFDFDGTLVVNDGWKGVEHAGAPIPEMIAKVKEYLAQGMKVKIFTARVSHEDEEENERARQFLHNWSEEYIGQRLEVTNEKDIGMEKLYDDRALHVIENTGVVV